MTDEDRILLVGVIEEVRLLRQSLDEMGSGDDVADKFALYRERVLARRSSRKPEA